MTTLSEAESKALLRRYGVPVAREEVVATPDAAAEAAARIGFPVVAKLCGPAIAHKTERGLVRLGLRDARGGAGRGCRPARRAPCPTTVRSVCSSRPWCRASAS